MSLFKVLLFEMSAKAKSSIIGLIIKSVQNSNQNVRFCGTNYVSTEIRNDLERYVLFKKFLKNSKIFYKDGFTCLHVECRICKNQSTPKTAFVNKRTGYFMCPACDIKRTLSEVACAYEKGVSLNIEEKCYHSLFPNKIETTEGTLSNLGIRDLKEKHLKTLGAKYEPNQNLLVFPLVNAESKVVGEKTLHLVDKTEKTFQKSPSGLLMLAQQNRNKAILVNNLLDYIALSTVNLETYSVVCLPYSLKNVPQECLPALERFKELIFWFSFDPAGWGSAISFANKMEEKRCKLIRPTATEPCPLESVRNKLNIRHVIQRALPVRHKSITTFNYLRNEVLSELQNVEKVNGVKWKRFPILNKLLKGHRKGELTIITGPTGSGKTTFMSEYSLDLAIQGVSTLWGSFEIRNSRLASTLLRQYVGYSLENKLNEFEHWATEFEKYPLYFMTFHGQQPIKVVMEAIEHAQYVHDINHVIIDNLQFMMGMTFSTRSDKFWEQDSIIAAFRSFATNRNVHVTLVMHPRKERQEEDLTTSSVFGTAKATQEADNVLIIQDKRLTALRGKKFLQIVKNRYSGDLGIMPLEFDKEGLSYASNRRKKSNNM